MTKVTVDLKCNNPNIHCKDLVAELSYIEFEYTILKHISCESKFLSSDTLRLEFNTYINLQGFGEIKRAGVIVYDLLNDKLLNDQFSVHNLSIEEIK